MSNDDNLLFQVTHPFLLRLHAFSCENRLHAQSFLSTLDAFSKRDILPLWGVLNARLWQQTDGDTIKISHFHSWAQWQGYMQYAPAVRCPVFCSRAVLGIPNVTLFAK